MLSRTPCMSQSASRSAQNPAPHLLYACDVLHQNQFMPSRTQCVAPSSSRSAQNPFWLLKCHDACDAWHQKQINPVKDAMYGPISKQVRSKPTWAIIVHKCLVHGINSNTFCTLCWASSVILIKCPDCDCLQSARFTHAPLSSMLRAYSTA